MSDVVSGILNRIGGDGVSKIAKSLGVDDNMMSSAITAALPTILAGMAKNASEGKVDSLSNALDDHDPSIFDQLGSLLGGENTDGSKILGHIFGGSRPATEQNLASRSGLDLGTVMKLLPMLAPLVMGYLSKKKKESNLDSSSLSNVLRKETEEVEGENPGLLDSILGGDGQGSMIKDILGGLIK